MWIAATDWPVSATARLSARVAAQPPLAPAATAVKATAPNNSRPNTVLLALAALEQVLGKLGAKVTPGAGVAAAEAVYAGH